jgi:catechol 2,3-dioxygenase-like lactoylglutathione lyase family enzyme
VSNAEQGATFRPRLNHVAISVDPSVFDEQGRADVTAFYGDVFGWSEGDNTGEKGNPLILYTGAFGQFVYLLPATPAMEAPPLDHFGLQVSTVAEIDEIVARARRFEEHDDRVRIIERSARTTRGATDDYTLTSAYIGFVLPLMIELQHLERVPRHA